MTETSADIAVVGAGAAGIFAAIWAARTNPALRVIAIDGAKTLGAKILVAGGGRCNVTHHAVDERDYAGSPPALVQRVLRRFGVEETIAFFEQAGVTLKREESGKLFPTTDQARTVLTALLAAARDARVEILHPMRVESLTKTSNGFVVATTGDSITARCVILATGGLSLPKSGSDGSGLRLAQSLGHTLTALLNPALVPLTLPAGHWLTGLSGLALPAEITVVTHTGKVARDTNARAIPAIHGAVLLTHFGLSGPAILDVSRHWLNSMASDGASDLVINWMPGTTEQALEQELIACKGKSVIAALHARVPDRFLRAACAQGGVDCACGVQQLPRARRQALVQILTAHRIKPAGTRGFVAAETTAGGVPLAQFNLDRLESLQTAELFMCGEVLDVDGRLGGFSFQWAWSSGYVAGCAAAHSAGALRSQSSIA